MNWGEWGQWGVPAPPPVGIHVDLVLFGACKERGKLLGSSGGSRERGRLSSAQGWWWGSGGTGVGSAGTEELGQGFVAGAVGSTTGKGPLGAWDVVGARGAARSHWRKVPEGLSGSQCCLSAPRGLSTAQNPALLPQLGCPSPSPRGEMEFPGFLLTER